jgi:transposase
MQRIHFVSDAQAEIQGLVARRRQLVEILTAEQNRLSGLQGTAGQDVEASPRKGEGE